MTGEDGGERAAGNWSRNRRDGVIDSGVEYDAQLAMWHAWYGYRQRWFRQRHSAEAWLAAQK